MVNEKGSLLHFLFSTTLLGTGHVIITFDDDCARLITQYFETGDFAFTDGHFCPAPFADVSLIKEAYNIDMD